MKAEEKPSGGKRLKVLALLVVVVVATLAAGYYYYHSLPSLTVPTGPKTFSLVVGPEAFPLSPGWGRNITVGISRLTNFNADVNVGLVNGPSWVYFTPIVIHAWQTNATMFIMTNQTAPKGTVDLNVMASAAGSADQSTVIRMRIVGVLNVSSSVGTAEVYETTKVLDNSTMAALTGYNSSIGMMQFNQVTTSLQNLEPGDVIVGPPGTSSVAPKGFLQTVLSIQLANGGATLETEQTTVLELFRTAHIGGGPQSSGSSASASAFGVRGITLRPETDFPIIPSTTFSHTEDLNNGYSMGVSLTLEAHIFFGLDMDQIAEDACVVAAAVFLPCVVVASAAGSVNFFATTLKGHEEADAWFKGPGGDVNWSKPSLIHIFGPLTIPIFPPFLWIDLNGDVEGILSGHLHETDIEAKATFDFSFGPVYLSGQYGSGGWQLEHKATPDFKVPPVKLGFATGDHLRGELGPRMDLDLDAGVIGGSLAFHVFLELTEQIPHNPVAWLDGGVDLTEGFNALFKIVKLSFGPQDLVRINIWNSPDQPPTVTISSPADGSTIDLSGPGLERVIQFSAEVSDPEGDTCNQGISVVWVSDLDGQLGTGCTTGPIEFHFAGTHHITVTATDSGGEQGTASVTITVKLPQPPQVQVGPISCIQNDVFVCMPGQQASENEAIQLSDSATILDPSTGLTYKVPCPDLTWNVASSTTGVPVATSNNNNGCSVTVTFTTADTYTVALSVSTTYNGQTYTGTAGPVTIAVVAPTSTTNFPPEAIITSPPPNGKNDFSQPEAPIQLSAVILDEPENEAVTWSWTAYWGGGVRVPLYSYPIASGTASPPYGYNLPESQISYSWDPRNTICNDPDFSTTYRGAPNGVTLELTVTDPGGNSNGGAGPYRVTITLGCQAPTGAISVPFSTGPLQTITSGPISTIETATSPNIRSSKASITIRQSPY